MMDRKPTGHCYLCGEPCWGTKPDSTCEECHKKGKHKKLTRVYNYRNKKVSHER